MTSPHPNPANKWSSPSNATVTVLIGFLFVGHSSDWKMLHGRPSRSTRMNATGAPGLTAKSPTQHDCLTGLHLDEPRSNSKSVVADNRPVTHDRTSRREID